MTQQSKDEWGPWIDHDGQYVPQLAGSFVESTVMCDQRGPMTSCHWIKHGIGGSWGWENEGTYCLITCYRIRKPRGMAVLEAIARNVPEYISAKENT